MGMPAATTTPEAESAELDLLRQEAFLVLRDVLAGAEEGLRQTTGKILNRMHDELVDVCKKFWPEPMDESQGSESSTLQHASDLREEGRRLIQETKKVINQARETFADKVEELLLED